MNHINSLFVIVLVVIFQSYFYKYIKTIFCYFLKLCLILSPQNYLITKKKLKQENIQKPDQSPCCQT